MKKCKYYDVCGFEADKTDFPPYTSSKNGKTYYRNVCASCFKKWNNEKSKLNYQKSNGGYSARMIQQKNERMSKDPEFAKHIKEQALKWRVAHREEHKQYVKAYSRKPENRFEKAKRENIKRGIDWLLSYEDFIDISSQPCYYCSNQLCNPVEVGSGLDRLDSTKCYTRENVVPCGKICNQIKMDTLTSEEAKVAITAILAFRASVHP